MLALGQMYENGIGMQINKKKDLAYEVEDGGGGKCVDSSHDKPAILFWVLLP